MFLHSLSSFLCKHCICGHTCDYSIVDMPSLRSARYICLAANSICFRFAQARYDIDPRSRSEYIECVSTYRTRQRISKIRASGSISTRRALKGTTLKQSCFFIKNQRKTRTQKTRKQPKYGKYANITLQKACKNEKKPSFLAWFFYWKSTGFVGRDSAQSLSNPSFEKRRKETSTEAMLKSSQTTPPMEA